MDYTDHDVGGLKKADKLFHPLTRMDDILYISY